MRMSIYNIDENGGYIETKSFRNMIKLSEGMTADMRLQPAAQLRAVRAMLEFKSILAAEGVHDVTAVAICEDGSSVGYEGDFETQDQQSIENLISAIEQLEDLRCDREGFAADFEDEEDNAFCLDVAAIDTALAAIKRLIELEYEKE